MHGPLNVKHICTEKTVKIALSSQYLLFVSAALCHMCVTIIRHKL